MSYIHALHIYCTIFPFLAYYQEVLLFIMNRKVCPKFKKNIYVGNFFNRPRLFVMQCILFNMQST